MNGEFEPFQFFRIFPIFFFLILLRIRHEGINAKTADLYSVYCIFLHCGNSKIFCSGGKPKSYSFIGFPVELFINKVSAWFLQLLNIVVLVPIQSAKLEFSVSVRNRRVICAVSLLHCYLPACTVSIETVLGTAKLLILMGIIHLAKL